MLLSKARPAANPLCHDGISWGTSLYTTIKNMSAGHEAGGATLHVVVLKLKAQKKTMPGWGVLRVKLEDDSATAERELDVKGTWPWAVADIEPGVRLKISVGDAQRGAYGSQCALRTADLHPGTRHLKVVKDLLAAGVPIGVAQRLCAAFCVPSSPEGGAAAASDDLGGSVWDILARTQTEDSWDQLRRAVPGITKEHVEKLKALDSSGAAFRREAESAFPALSVPQVHKLVKLLDDRSVDTLRHMQANPFRLWAVGVLKSYAEACDYANRTLPQLGPGDARWDEAYLVHVMQERAKQHRQVCVPQGQLEAMVQRGAELIEAAEQCSTLTTGLWHVGRCAGSQAAREECVAEAEASDEIAEEGLLFDRLAAFQLVKRMGSVYLLCAANSEACIVRCVQRLQAKSFPPSSSTAAAESFLADSKLTEQQRAAVHMLLTAPFCLLTGGAGTGKTLVVHSAAHAFQRMQPGGGCVLMVAPTGAAALRMMAGVDTGPTCETHTIHKVLCSAKYADKVPFKDDRKPVLAIVDESSMLDLHVCGALFELARTHGWRLALIGDPHQLPPVGVGAPFASLLSYSSGGSSGAAVNPVPHVHLTQSMRTADSGLAVARAAEQVLARQVPLDERGAGFRLDLLPNGSYATVVEAACAAAREMQSSPGAPLPQFVTATNSMCMRLNEALRELRPVAQPPAQAQPYPLFEDAKWAFREGDLVVLQKNRYSQGDPKELLAANGSRGRVHAIRLHPHTGGLDTLDVALVDTYGVDMFGPSGGRLILTYWHSPQSEDMRRSGRIRHLRPAYCITVHKSQGSEYRSVVYVACGSSFGRSNDFLYTALTRASRQCRILATPEYISMAASTVESKPLDNIARTLGLNQETDQMDAIMHISSIE